MKRSTIMVILLAVFFFTAFPGISFAVENDEPFKLAENVKAAILMEQDTGTILYEENGDEPLPPASMTKIMTMLLVMEALDAGKIRLDDTVRTSTHAASMGGSQIFLEEGEEMTVEELLLAVAIASANDASVALAEHIAGSEEVFVEMMNKRAEELGLKNTRFQNATGLPAENHFSSARDIAIMSRELLKHEEITKYTGRYESYLRENTDDKFWLVNTNRLVKFYPGVDGLKTGFTNEARYCLSATAEKNGMRVIAVVFGAPTAKERNKQITRMLDFAFSQYETVPVYEKGATVGEVVVQKGEMERVPVQTKDKVSFLKKKGEKTEDVQPVLRFDENLQAPVKRGDVVGQIVLQKDGKELGKTDLIASKDVAPAAWWTLYKRTFGQFTKVD